MPRIHKKRTGNSSYDCIQRRIEERRQVREIELAVKGLLRIGVLMQVGETDGEPAYALTEFGYNLRYPLPDEQTFNVYVMAVHSLVCAGGEPSAVWAAFLNVPEDEIARAMKVVCTLEE